MRFYTNGNDNILRHLYVGNCMRKIERKMQTHVCIAKLYIAYMQCTFVASHIHFYFVCIQIIAKNCITEMSESLHFPQNNTTK